MTPTEEIIPVGSKQDPFINVIGYIKGEDILSFLKDLWATGISSVNLGIGGEYDTRAYNIEQLTFELKNRLAKGKKDWRFTIEPLDYLKFTFEPTKRLNLLELEEEIEYDFLGKIKTLVVALPTERVRILYGFAWLQKLREDENLRKKSKDSAERYEKRYQTLIKWLNKPIQIDKNGVFNLQTSKKIGEVYSHPLSTDSLIATIPASY